MDFMVDIKTRLLEEKFSFELLNYCKSILQYIRLNEEEMETFKKLLFMNIKKNIPEISEYEIEQIIEACIEGSICDIEDILFLDNSSFVIRKVDELNITKIDFIWKSKEYIWCDFFNLSYFFYDKRIKKRNKQFLEKIRDELNDIFVEYFNIRTFPLELGMDYTVSQEFAIKCNKEEIINGLNNSLPFSISIICNICDTKDIQLVKLTYQPNKDKLIIVDGLNSSYNKLSSYLEEKKELLKIKE